MVPEFDGLLVLNKPVGITSREAVDQAACWFPRQTRIGHTGTLDPLASGVLVLCIGTATRLVEYVQDMRKVYRSSFQLGSVSTTEDREGTITPIEGAVPPRRAEVETVLQRFLGRIEQVPPAFSAARVEGKRAHDLARKGAEVSLRPRTIHIHRLEILRYEYPLLDVEVECGKGTYIRSLARDVGEALGVGAYIEELHRGSVGPFRDSDGVPFTLSREQAQQRLLPRSLALSELPRVELSADLVFRLRRGQKLPISELETMPPGEVAVFDTLGQLVGVAYWGGAGSLLRPSKIFN